MQSLQSAFGVVALLAIAWIFSEHRLAVSWRRVAISLALTVVLALLTLVLATIPMTRGLGVPAAIGLLIALVAVLFVLPPALAVCGRRLFWPFVPRPGESRDQGGVWRAVASINS